MKDKPILFSTKMVKAIIEGRKTQTRRIIKPQPDKNFELNPDYNDFAEYGTLKGEKGYGFFDGKKIIKCPYQIGQTLWVRETFIPNYFDNGDPAYKADWTATAAELLPEPKWKSPYHMHRYESRINLEVTNIRVERLQDITSGDIVKEGYIGDMPLVNGFPWFKLLWNSINEKRGYGWDKNPYVWVIEFKKI